MLQIDVPDSGDFTDFVKEELLAEGVALENIFPVSAATGQGVLDLVRRVRQVRAAELHHLAGESSRPATSGWCP